MKEIDFDYIVKFLEWEICRLSCVSELKTPSIEQAEMPISPATSMAEYLKTLLAWIKSAIAVERERKRVDVGSPSHSEFSALRALWRDQADLLESVRLQLKGRNAKDILQKLQFIRQEEILATAAAMLRGGNEGAGSLQ